MRGKRSVAAYAAGHFLVDLCCAALMFRFARPSGAWAGAALLYNMLAFAGQAPLGLLADRLGHGRLFAAAGCVLTAGASVLGAYPLALAVTAGVGNALYHVGGGRDILAESGDRAGPLGVFVSPGAFGLFLGTLLGKGSLPLWPVPALLLLTAGAILLLCGPVPAKPVFFKGGAAALAALFLVVCLRSYTGFLMTYPWKTGAWAWIFVLCVVLGKTFGGLLYDRLGGRGAALISLLGAAALFLFPRSALCGCGAALLFNLTMPVTLRAAAALLPGARGFSFGLLTLALFLGFLPAWLGLPAVREGWMYAALALLSLGLLLPAVKGRRP